MKSEIERRRHRHALWRLHAMPWVRNCLGRRAAQVITSLDYANQTQHLMPLIMPAMTRKTEEEVPTGLRCAELMTRETEEDWRNSAIGTSSRLLKKLGR